MVLVDSSSWIEALRDKGRPEVRQRVRTLLALGTACWCDAVRLELWNGARGDAEKKVLQDLDRSVPILPIDDDVWDNAIDLAKKARAGGITVPAIDLIIFSCARRHGATVEHNDAHMSELQQLV